MFTGIVQGTAQVVAIDEKERFRTHTLEMPSDQLDGLGPGGSVAHNGCCLTVTEVADNRASFDLMHETLRVTNLGALAVGDAVNIERAARFGEEIGGHAMSGHIIAMAEVVHVEESPNNYRIRFQVPEHLSKYLFAKGYIGIDGISLTIGEVEDALFDVYLIPETLNRTNIGTRKVGDFVNIEVDPHTQAIVDTVERVLADRL